MLGRPLGGEPSWSIVGGGGAPPKTDTRQRVPRKSSARRWRITPASPDQLCQSPGMRTTGMFERLLAFMGARRSKSGWAGAGKRRCQRSPYGPSASAASPPGRAAGVVAPAGAGTEAEGARLRRHRRAPARPPARGAFRLQLITGAVAGDVRACERRGGTGVAPPCMPADRGRWTTSRGIHHRRARSGPGAGTRQAFGRNSCRLTLSKTRHRAKTNCSPSADGADRALAQRRSTGPADQSR